MRRPDIFYDFYSFSSIAESVKLLYTHRAGRRFDDVPHRPEKPAETAFAPAALLRTAAEHDGRRRARYHTESDALQKSIFHQGEISPFLKLTAFIAAALIIPRSQRVTLANFIGMMYNLPKEKEEKTG
ncbi:MAG: hypothetical protein IK136_02230 [Oscillospiraceae bacterium]|nr:hypothetical protein [Oscillospiraceae bacterium]